MLSYVARRIMLMVPTLIAISLIAFGIILLYEHFSGTYLTQFQFNPNVTEQTIEQLEEDLGLGQPWYVRYYKWITGLFTGQVESFQYNRPVIDLFLTYLPNTLLMTVPVFIFIWIVALPIGIYSSTHQYSFGDHTFTFLAFLGLSVPNFFLALIVIYLLAGPLDVGQQCWQLEGSRYCLSVGGLFSQQYTGNPAPWTWSLGKWFDYLWHLWPIVLVIGTSVLAGFVRVMRGNMLDILGSNYVQTARAKGLRERVVVYKHAVRNAINPMVSIFGLSLNFLITGALVTAIVLNIPTLELLFYESLQSADEYLILTLLTFFSLMLLIGNLVADVLLALVDPRIRYD